MRSNPLPPGFLLWPILKLLPDDNYEKIVNNSSNADRQFILPHTADKESNTN